MTMTLTELVEHTDNLTQLLLIKRGQLSHMSVDAVARERHELAITALEGRVRELRRRADELRSDPPAPLRGDTPPLKVERMLPGGPPLIDMGRKSKPVRDLPSAPGDLCSELF